MPKAMRRGWLPSTLKLANSCRAMVTFYATYGADDQVADQGKYIVLWPQVDGAWKLHRDIFNSSLPNG